MQKIIQSCKDFCFRFRWSPALIWNSTCGHISHTACSGSGLRPPPHHPSAPSSAPDSRPLLLWSQLGGPFEARLPPVVLVSCYLRQAGIHSRMPANGRRTKGSSGIARRQIHSLLREILSGTGRDSLNVPTLALFGGRSSSVKWLELMVCLFFTFIIIKVTYELNW